MKGKLFVVAVLVWVYIAGFLAGYLTAADTGPACEMEIDQ